MVCCSTMVYLPSERFHIYLQNDYRAWDCIALVKNMGILSTSGGYLYSSDKWEEIFILSVNWVMKYHTMPSYVSPAAQCQHRDINALFDPLPFCARP